MSKVKLDDLLPTQKRVLGLSDKLIIWIGSIRGGKGVGTANKMIRLMIHNLLNDSPCNAYALAGQSHMSFIRNNEGYIADIAYQAGLDFRTHDNTYILSIPGTSLKATCYIFGGGNARSYHNLRGITIHSGWIDEATLCDPQFVTTMIERCTFADSQVIMTSNADRPNHWLKTDYLDIGVGKHIESGFDENWHYSDVRREEIRNLNPFSSNHKRAIENIWAGDEGLVYVIPETVKGEYPPVEQSFLTQELHQYAQPY